MARGSGSSSNKEVIDCLNRIYQAEMSGVSRYLHYSFMIMGHNRIPIQKWFRDNAMEGITHAVLVGEKITSLGGHPTMVVPNVPETNSHAVNDLLKDVLNFEQKTTELYKELVQLAMEREDIALEELARTKVLEETEHTEEVEKMLRPAGK